MSRKQFDENVQKIDEKLRQDSQHATTSLDYYNRLKSYFEKFKSTAYSNEYWKYADKNKLNIRYKDFIQDYMAYLDFTTVRIGGDLSNDFFMGYPQYSWL